MTPSQPAPDKTADGWPFWSILVVDDEQGMRNFLVKTLMPRCQLVMEAESAERHHPRGPGHRRPGRHRDPGGGCQGAGHRLGLADYTPEAFLKAIHTGLNAYANKDLWRRIMEHAMTQDFSWKVSARKYLELYKSLV